LIPLRAVIGASQAFFNPAAYTLIAEIFPKKMIGSINGIFSGGIYLGGALASLSIILDGEIGWRSSLLVIGGLGLLISALCYFVVPEPHALIEKANGNFDQSEVSGRTGSQVSVASGSMKAAVNEVKGKSDALKAALSSLKEVLQSPVAKLLFSASMLRFCAGFSIAIWKAPFVFAKFPESASSFAGNDNLMSIPVLISIIQSISCA
jgi:MFS family permease